MNSRTDTKILRKLAAISPVSYRDQIRERNTQLLEKLEELWRSGSQGCKSVLIGCPHCSGSCDQCMWSWAGADRMVGTPCCFVSFSGYRLKDIARMMFMNVTYSSQDAGVCCFSYAQGRDERLRYSEYRACKAFIMEHIRWCDEMEWGTQVQQEK